MLYTATNSFSKINETGGTIQNTSQISAVEVSKEQVDNSGILLYPLGKFSFSGETLYIRCVDNNAEAVVRVVPFTVNMGAGSGGSSSNDSGNSGIATDEEIDDLLGDIFG